MTKSLLTGWGNYPKLQGYLKLIDTKLELLSSLRNENFRYIARGGGTSYGDASIAINGITLELSSLNKIISFNCETGILHCESGVILQDIVRQFLPMGWCLNVTPGTQKASIGGCIACDAHGKNWAAGSFSNFLISFNLALPGGEVLFCDRYENSDLFYATTGGMGQTGVVIDAVIQLKKIPSSILEVETVPFANIYECLQLQLESMTSHEYVFCWLDSLLSGENMGRGVMQRANHKAISGVDKGKSSKRKMYMPNFLPYWTINRVTVSIFNALYYRSAKRKTNDVFFTDFFYPLDGIDGWNRIYGRRGFIEYQITIPFDCAIKVLKQIMQEVTNTKLGSFIAAIKPIGDSEGIISFPRKGFTLAIDFAFNPKVLNLLDKLDQICIESGGRVYLSKDSRVSVDAFSKMYSDGLPVFDSILRKYSIQSKMNSSLWDRVRGFK